MRMSDRPSGLQPVEASAVELIQRALERCAQRSGETTDGVLERMRQGVPAAHGAFRYALAKELSAYLGRLGVPFRAVYVYGSAMTDAATAASDIDIIVDLEHDSDCVDRLLRGLDIALATQYRALVPRASRLGSLLDVRFVRAHAASRDMPYTGELFGGSAAPVCLWRTPSPRTASGPTRPVPEPRALTAH
jgi:hypothetical protein